MKIQNSKSASVETHFGRITLEKIDDAPMRLYITGAGSIDPEIFIVELATALSDFKAEK